jgi:hypothetical protein
MFYLMAQIRQLLRNLEGLRRAALTCRRTPVNFLARALGPEYQAQRDSPGAGIMNAFLAHPAAAFAAVVVFSGFISASPAGAQPPPACDAATLGTTACLASKMCACSYDRGGVATGVPAGYRWDCGILRPGCGSSFAQPATLNPYTGPYPHAVGIDRSHGAVTVEQTNTSTNTNVNRNATIERRTPAGPVRIGDPLPLLPPE